MRFKRETLAEKQQRLGEWREWFAWHPVHVFGGRYAWLETVYRRCEICAYRFPTFYTYNWYYDFK
jgi:hypothetical protein